MYRYKELVFAVVFSMTFIDMYDILMGMYTEYAKANFVMYSISCA